MLTTRDAGRSNATTIFGTTLKVEILGGSGAGYINPTSRTNGLDRGIYDGIGGVIYSEDAAGNKSGGSFPDTYAKGGTVKLTPAQAFAVMDGGGFLYHDSYIAQTQPAQAGTDYNYTPAVPDTEKTLYDTVGNGLTAKQAMEMLDNGSTVYADNTQTTAVTSANVNTYIRQNGFTTTIIPPNGSDGGLDVSTTQPDEDGYIVQYFNYIHRKPQTISLHVGADATSNNQIHIKLRDMGVMALHLAGTSVLTEEDSLHTIDRVSDALTIVNEHRSYLGAIQNRLEHTIRNLDNVVENTQAAESQIRDTDMSKELVDYTTRQVLVQSSEAMLAQANSSGKGVLSLIT